MIDLKNKSKDCEFGRLTDEFIEVHIVDNKISEEKTILSQATHLNLI